MYPNTIVIGGGIGGLAIAAGLARKGTAVTLLEQAPEITEVGAGLQITPNGLPMLRLLGLDRRLARVSVAAQAVVLEDYAKGREVARINVAGPDRPPYQFVHRADLIAMLYQAARQNAVTFELGTKVKTVVPGELPQVILADGSTRQAKLVICADGLHSVGRPVLNGAAEPFFTGQVAWRALVPAHSAVAAEARVTMGPGRHIVRYPLRGGDMINLVAVEERAAWAEEGWHQRDDPENLRRAFAGFGGPVAHMLDDVKDVHLWGLFRHPVAETWFEGGVALLGDAAHPTLPFLAQGANMALEDAYALLHCVDTGQLSQYRTIRHARVSKVVNAASKNAWRYHLRNPAMRMVGHAGLSVLSRVVPSLMVRQFDWLYGYDIAKALKRL